MKNRDMKVRISMDDQIAFPTWIRIVVGSFAAVTGSMMIFMHPHDFLQGIGQISIALFLIFMKYRQRNESFQEYMAKPRSVITLVSAIIVVASSFAWIVRELK
jgi:predicted Na+-dependent transporter